MFVEFWYIDTSINRITATGAYMCHRFSWASFKRNNFFQIFVLLLRLITQNVAELFNLTSGIRVRVKSSCPKDVSRGSMMGHDI
jgi:hypothetical protein